MNTSIRVVASSTIICNIFIQLKINLLYFRPDSTITTSSSPRPPAPNPTEDLENEETDVVNNNNDNSGAAVTACSQM